MVEAPGTAPGSETLMSRGVYRHSRFPDTAYIGEAAGNLKAWQAHDEGFFVLLLRLLE